MQKIERVTLSATARNLCGSYVGHREVRPNREEELTPKERKALAKDTSSIPLVLRPDATFSKEVTTGTWTFADGKITFSPGAFNGDTLEAMKARTEAMGRSFGLAFLFESFALLPEGQDLVTPDDGTPLRTRFVRDEAN